MATKYSSRFNSSGKPVNGKVVRPIGGCAFEEGAIDDLSAGLNDFNGFLPVPAGARIGLIFWDLADADTGGTPTATGKIILRRVVDGVTTDTDLKDLDTAVQAADRDFAVIDLQAVEDDDNGYGIVGLLFDAAAATAGTGANKLAALWY